MKKKGIILLIFLIILTFSVKAECTRPGQFISSNIEFCKDTYFINKEITIVKDNVVVDCSNSDLVGDYTSIGLSLENLNNITIKNCKISNFLTGIDAKKTSNLNIKGNVFLNNTLAVKLYNINNASVKSDFFNNVNNIDETKECLPDNFCPDVCNIENDIDCIVKQPEIGVFKGKIEEIVKTKEKNIIELEVDNKIKQDLEITQTKEIRDNKTYFETKLKAKKNLKGLIINLYFPEGSISDEDIIQANVAYDFIEEDNLVQTNIGSIKKGGEKTVNYVLNRAVSKNPIVVVSIETQRNYVIWFLLIFLAFYLFINAYELWSDYSH